MLMPVLYCQLVVLRALLLVVTRMRRLLLVMERPCNLTGKKWPLMLWIVMICWVVFPPCWHQLVAMVMIPWRIFRYLHYVSSCSSSKICLCNVSHSCREKLNCEISSFSVCKMRCNCCCNARFRVKGRWKNVCSSKVSSMVSSCCVHSKRLIVCVFCQMRCKVLVVCVRVELRVKCIEFRVCKMMSKVLLLMCPMCSSNRWLKQLALVVVVCNKQVDLVGLALCQDL
jgi:hypothetical protein